MSDHLYLHSSVLGTALLPYFLFIVFGAIVLYLRHESADRAYVQPCLEQVELGQDYVISVSCPPTPSEKCGLGVSPSGAPFQESEKCGLGVSPSGAPFQESEKCGLGARAFGGKLPPKTSLVSPSGALFQESEKCGLGVSPSGAPFQENVEAPSLETEFKAIAKSRTVSPLTEADLVQLPAIPVARKVSKSKRTEDAN